MKININPLLDLLKEKTYCKRIFAKDSKTGKYKEKKIKCNLESSHIESLEKLIFLCLNKSFTKNVKRLRSELSVKVAEKLPLKAEKEDRAATLLLKIHKSKPLKVWYRDQIRRLCEKHSLSSHSFYFDSFKGLEIDIKAIAYMVDKSGVAYHPSERKRLANKYSLPATNVNGLAKAEAENICSKNRSILGNIIFFNNPLQFNSEFCSYDISTFPPLHISQRGSLFNIRKDEWTGERYIEARFDIHSTKNDMKKAIDALPSLIELGQWGLKSRGKRDHRKDALDKSVLALQLRRQGKKYFQIACELEENGYKGGEWGDEDAIRVGIKRLEKEIAKYNDKSLHSSEQET